MDAILETLVAEYMSGVGADVSITFDTKVIVQATLANFCALVAASNLLVPA